ncbi:MAG: PAS domain S-box protein, partial [Actinomycetota bacterium]|nr:PAS domain S-box protein [Actinomycetota bacterium]
MPLVAVLIVLLSIAILLLYGLPAAKSRLGKYAEERALGRAAAAAAAVGAAEPDDFQRGVDLAARSGGGEVLVVDEQGHVIARGGARLLPSPPEEILRAAAKGERTSKTVGDRRVVTAPLLREGSLAGGIVFVPDEAEDAVYEIFSRSNIEAAAIAAVLGSGLMLLVATLLSRRVERLNLSAHSIEQGDLSSRIEPGFGDELGELAKTFNAMAARLQDSFAHLEERVAERTEQLEAERARLETVLRQMPAGVIIAEAPSGRLILGNAQVEQIWGHPFQPAASIEEYPHQYRIFHLDGRPYQLEERPLVRSIRTGEEVSGEEIGFLRTDGTSGTMQVSSAPIRDRDGHIVAGVAIFKDITKQKRAEEELRASEERFRATFEQAAVGIAQTAPDGSWLRVNDKLCDIVGYTREELLRKSFQDVTHPDDLSENVEHVRRLLAGEVESFSMEKRYIRKDGSAIWTNV